MAFEVPNLDDRNFEDIVAEARARIPLYTTEWTDHGPSDPGMTLIELFAYMVDMMLYRLNRVPDKHFIKFMELLGMRLQDPTPARVELSFWLTTPSTEPFVIPSSTTVATERTETEQQVVFATDGTLVIKVPKLAHMMTSYENEGARAFDLIDLGNLQSGYESVAIFNSTSPRVDDALYFGFDEDLSYHLLGVEMMLGQAEGAGINPNNPPYVWEVLGRGQDNRWVKLEVDLDSTLALNQSGLIRVHLPEMVRSVRGDVNAYWVRCRLEPREDEPSYANSPRLTGVSVSSWGGTIGASNVTHVKEMVLGRSDGTPGQRFYLEHTPVVTRTADEYILVRLEDGREQRWQEVTDFSTSNATDRHYIIDSQDGEVRFGPALPQPDGQIRRFGALPPKGAMIIMSAYRYGGGQVGNVAAHTIRLLQSSLPYVGKVTNRAPARGGMDAENTESAKMRVPGYLRSLQRAVTGADFEYLAKEALPGQIGRAYCLQPPLTNRGEIRLLVIPHIPVLKGFLAPESLELQADVRDTLFAYLDERRLLSTKLMVDAPAYRWVETEVHISIAPFYDVDKVLRAVEDRLFEFINPVIGGAEGKGWEFGRDLLSSDVVSAIAQVEGVRFVREVKLFPMTYEARAFRRGDAVNEITVPSDGVVASYQHNIIRES